MFIFLFTLPVLRFDYSVREVCFDDRDGKRSGAFCSV